MTRAGFGRSAWMIVGAMLLTLDMKAQAPSADLSVVSITAPAATVGNNFSYTINVSNGGPSQATGVVVTDVLPASVSFVSASAPGGTCSANLCPPAAESATVVCALAGTTAAVTITVRPNSIGTIRNVAGVAGNEVDPNLTNNSKWIDTTVNPQLPPTVTGLSRSSGPTAGNTLVSIYGSNFVAPVSVKFGLTPATVNNTLSNQIDVTTPGHAVGPVNVTVTNNDGQAASYQPQFTYQCSSSISISPSSLPQGTVAAAYNQLLTATGGTGPYSFAVTSGLLPAGLSLSSGGILSGTPTASGSFSFTITATDSWQCTGSNFYTLTISPATLGLNSIFPTFGLTAGGTRVTIYGAGFQPGVTVTFGNVPGTNLTLVDSTTIQVTAPGPGTGSIDVIVTNPNFETQRLTNGFSYGGINSYSVPPCRVLDTRGPAGPYGLPALNAGADRAFVFINRCGVPPTAKAVIVNVAVTTPTDGPGFFSLYPGGTQLPRISTINYSAGQTRANNAIVPLGSTAGVIIIHCGQGTGTAHVIVDVSGYLQ